MADSTSIPNFIFFSSLLLSISSTTTTVATTASVCKDTPYPSFCQTFIPINNSSSNLHDYGRFSIRKSISTATKFSNLIDKYLTTSTTVTTAVIHALQDCQYLARLNVDFLLATYRTVSAGQTSLPATTSEHAQTMLSAILTNTQTCIDGLQTNAASWTSKNGVFYHIQNDNKLYSVSLALFNKGWGSKTNNKFDFSNRKQTGFGNDRFPRFKMSEQSTAIFETVGNGRRKVVQGGGAGDEVDVSDVVVVSQDGSGNFTTIADAVDFAPNKSASGAGYFLVYVTAGVYEEYVNIHKKKKYLMMIGDGINQTVITGNHSVADGWTTFQSGTFIVAAPYFVAMNITIRNTAGPTKHQAVALRNGADFSTFYRCSFEGYQDTLYAHSLRQFYRECDIYGTVDFIFGNAAVVFQNCNIYPRLPMRGQFNAITAQGRNDPGQNTGTSIQKCNIREADDLAAGDGTTVTYLGRPWRAFSRTVYMQSFMDELISPAGWLKWSSDSALITLYYGEFNNSGPGSETSERVPWPGFHVINAMDAVNFTAAVLIHGDDFLPQTGVPYDSGL
ncbi:probable pectinesterase/pectinesterase inhibitor 7 [Cynara cardunculus var. scolymus]|nr:probable pectinesterase/pectinesterase inhibitor 7 [Cynara cardunculus var. scolymus]